MNFSAPFFRAILVVVFAASAVMPSTGASAQDRNSIHSQINRLIVKHSKNKANFANSRIGARFREEGLRRYLDDYPVAELSGGFEWRVGMGREFTGPLSNLHIKAPFSDYLPLPLGPVLDTAKTYRIGFAYHGAGHPWLISLADTAMHEAGLHSNVEIDVRDAEFDDKKMAEIIDRWIAEKVDAIVLWPVRESPMGPPVDRAIDAGIPVVSLDRRTSSKKISSEILGNFYANGLQQGLFLNHVADGKGKMILNRKAQGSTADTMRTGAFLEAIGDGDYEILESFRTNSQRRKAMESTRGAVKEHSDLEIVFNTGGEEALGALHALVHAKRLYGAPGGKKVIVLANDDSKEAVNEVRLGNIDVVVPYTPLLGGLGVRVALLHVGFNEGRVKSRPGRQIITPNLPMITKEKMVIDGIETVTPDEWPYAYGPEPMILATVGQSSEQVRIIDRLLPESQPGWFVEVTRKAASECGAKAKFVFVPWARALTLVRDGRIAGAFNSSYGNDRARYGEYPMRDGAPDPSRSSSTSAYHLYVAAGSGDVAWGKGGKLDGRHIVAERGSSIVSKLESLGARVELSANYVSMLRMVAHKRVEAAVGIDHRFDSILADQQNLAAAIRKVESPFHKSVGYVMFSKPFYAEHGDIVKCYWSASSNLRLTQWFRDMRATYGR